MKQITIGKDGGMPRKPASSKKSQPKLKVKDMKPRKDAKGGRKAGEGQKDYF